MINFCLKILFELVLHPVLPLLSPPPQRGGGNRWGFLVLPFFLPLSKGEDTGGGLCLPVTRAKHNVPCFLKF
jgi:hypothetical protein